MKTYREILEELMQRGGHDGRISDKWGRYEGSMSMLEKAADIYAKQYAADVKKRVNELIKEIDKTLKESV